MFPMKLLNGNKIHFVVSVCAFLFLYSKGSAQTSSFITEFEYNKVNDQRLNPENIQEVPHININTLFLYSQTLKVLKGTLNWDIRFSALNQFIHNEQAGESFNRNKFRIDPIELFYKKPVGNFTFGAGRKKVKWGVGYVASPTDIVSQPPLPDDPGDRLFRIKGSDLAQISYVGTKAQYDLYLMPATNQNKLFFNDHSVAFKYFRSITPFDVSLVARADLDGRYQVGFNQTVTIGESLELHSDMIYQSTSDVPYPPEFQKKDEGTYRLLVGGQWSPKQNYNIVLEYFHLNEGYTPGQWNQLQEIVDLNLLLWRNDTLLAPIADANLKTMYASRSFPARKNYLFLRLYRNNIFKKGEIEWITFYGLDDAGSLNRIAFTYKFKSKYAIYSHYQFVTGVGSGGFGLLDYTQTARIGAKISF